VGGGVAVKIPRTLKLQNRRGKPAVRLEAAEIVVETSRGNLLQMVLPVSHVGIELVNHVMALMNFIEDVEMTILHTNLVTMTKLMLLMKPELLRCQFSFDDFLADEAVVGDGDVIGMLMSLASL